MLCSNVVDTEDSLSFGYLVLLFLCFCWSQAQFISKVAFKLLCMVYISAFCYSVLCILCWALVFLYQIVPSNCRYEVLTTKIEIRLEKAEPIHWSSLEFTKNVVVPQRVNASSGNLRLVWILEFPSSMTCLVTLV